jgi:uncharacterized protein
MFGWLIDKANRKAAARIQLLAAQGRTDAQLKMGLLCEAGKGVPQDGREAFNWYLKAAEGGNSEAQFRVGFILGSPAYGFMDMVQAIKWWRKAAVQGHAKAIQSLAIFKEPLSEDETDPFRNLKLAARHHDAKANYLIGIMYESGSEGFSKSLIEAYKHLALAGGRISIMCRTNSADPIENQLPELIPLALNRVKSAMTAAEIEQADKEVFGAQTTK